VLIIKICPPKQMPLLHPRSGSSVSSLRAATEAGESVIAQLHSRSKLPVPTPRRESRTIRHKNEILKANEYAPYV
jgi:hypothetical protein